MTKNERLAEILDQLSGILDGYYPMCTIEEQEYIGEVEDELHAFLREEGYFNNKLHSLQYINASTILNDLGINCWECDISEGIDYTDGFGVIYLSDTRIQQIQEEIEDCSDEAEYVASLQKELKIIRYLRKMGVNSEEFWIKYDI